MNTSTHTAVPNNLLMLLATFIDSSRALAARADAVRLLNKATDNLVRDTAADLIAECEATHWTAAATNTLHSKRDYGILFLLAVVGQAMRAAKSAAPEVIDYGFMNSLHLELDMLVSVIVRDTEMNYSYRQETMPRASVHTQANLKLSAAAVKMEDDTLPRAIRLHHAQDAFGVVADMAMAAYLAVYVDAGKGTTDAPPGMAELLDSSVREANKRLIDSLVRDC